MRRRVRSTPCPRRLDLFAGHRNDTLSLAAQELLDSPPTEVGHLHFPILSNRNGVRILKQAVVVPNATNSLDHRSIRTHHHAGPSTNTLAIAVMVFQFRVVTGTPKSRSNVPR